MIRFINIFLGLSITYGLHDSIESTFWSIQITRNLGLFDFSLYSYNKQKDYKKSLALIIRPVSK